MSCFVLYDKLYNFKSVPNNKILDWSKLNALADDKINVTEKLKFGIERVESIVGIGENAVNQHFLFLHYTNMKKFLKNLFL